MNSNHWGGFFFSGHNSQFESWKYLCLQPSLGGEEWLLLVDGGKRENGLDVCNFLKEWKWVGIMLGAWNFRGIS
jgi:hypothetical protein